MGGIRNKGGEGGRGEEIEKGSGDKNWIDSTQNIIH